MRAPRPVPALLTLALLLGLATPLAAGASPEQRPPANAKRTAPAARGRDAAPRVTGRLQVRFKDGVDAKGRDAAYARVARTGHKVHVDREIPGLNAAVLSVDSARAVHALLRAEKAVAFVEPESRYQALVGDPSTPELVEVGADQVHTGDVDNGVAPNVGTGAEIAVVDSVVDGTNPDLNTPGKVTFAGDFSTPVQQEEGDPSEDLDCDPANCPHGTAVAAVAAAEGDTGMFGVAPGAKIRSYNVFRRFRFPCPDPDPNAPPDSTVTCEEVGAGSGDIAAALVALKAYAPSHPSLVAVNMSLGGRFDNELVREAIAQLHAAAPHLTVVVAAGNDGSERASFPAGDPYVVSVGSIGQSQPQYDANGDKLPCPTVSSSTPWTVTSFSNRGDVDVVAPGRCVTSYFAPSADTGEVNGPVTLTKVDGTSFAAPMVAGVAALLSTAATPVYGDAARAAILAGALHTGTTVNTGVGRVKAPAAIDVSDGPGAYTAAFVDRGGQVATGVGRRGLEVLRVNPDSASAPVAAAITVPTGYGTVGPRTSVSSGNVTRTSATYAAPTDNKAGLGFTLKAAGSAAAQDTANVPVRLLDAGDNYEGVPAASNEATSVALTYGSRTGYVRSAAIPAAGHLDWTFTYDENARIGSADVWVWMPSTNGGTADAAAEPIWRENSPEITATDYIDAGCPELGGGCNYGRYLIGWLLGSAADNSTSTSRYRLTMTYAGPVPSLTTPAVASTVTASGPFRVYWGGTRATKWDVYYAQKVKSGTSWVITSWVPWKVGTTLTSAPFGTSGSPVTVTPGYTYHFLVRAYDSLGNPSLTTTKSTSAPLDDGSYHLAYSAGWGKGPASDRWLSSVHYTTAQGATVSVSSETERFTLVGDRCGTCGGIRVYVDGVLKATVDTYASSTRTRQSLWTSALLPGGPKAHTFKLVALGTPGRPRVVLDGIATQR